ncbi:two component, sigma54 specific, transcriptional regulator, Fis family [Desulfonatronospira thiodismutans ASO3-1]|uniref:Two component, sigma54 specific, transcriptional regulator, Fis family n=1 Tax=Desulfonatronospira thiodismutans ASO3-1 TaxID=555779 RepID=D6SKF6_9BACT|nr:two component, sigma54 specific, transcriptional regulator, Fis family [Desulfonatronospira thiodismutans ASO3-1]
MKKSPRIFIFSRDRTFYREAVREMRSLGSCHAADDFQDLRIDLLEKCEAIIMDLHLSQENQLNFFKKNMEQLHRPAVIVVTDEHDSDLIETAITLGAWDYFQKPVFWKRLRESVGRALEASSTLSAINYGDFKRCGIIGSSRSINSCLTTLASFARSNSNVLIYGETGTGKELFSRAVHLNSPRSHKPFIIIDCAALPENLVESTLFGHEKGAFTTADKKHTGLIRQAHGGSLFLDEIGELSLNTQKLFLRVLQERRFRPVGSATEIFCDFRLVAATNKDLDRMCAEGTFRRDLLFRLHSFALTLPPLNSREEDVLELMYYFLDRICKKHGLENKQPSPEVIDAFAGYSWPGNVRELINTLEHMAITARHEPVIQPEHLPLPLKVFCKQQVMEKDMMQACTESQEPARDEEFPKIKEYREQAIARIEKKYLEELLQASGKDMPTACRLSGLSRPRLYAMLKKYGLSPVKHRKI